MMDTANLTETLRLVAQRLETSGIPWGVFAGAAATCYGVQRAITDIDLFLQSADTARILALFPEGQPKPAWHSPHEHGLDIGSLELWWGTLALQGGEHTYLIRFDEPMRQRITRQTLLGVGVPALAPEDIIVLKAILQRGPEQGKHDLEDIQAIHQTLGQRLDYDYLKARALACNALERVSSGLQRLGISWEEAR